METIKKEVETSSASVSESPIEVQSTVENLKENLNQNYEEIFKAQQDQINQLLEQQKINQKMLEQFSHNMKQQVGLVSPKTREEKMYEELDKRIGRDFEHIASFRPDPDVVSSTSAGTEQVFSWLIKHLREVKKLSPEDTALALAYIKKKSLEATKNNGKELKKPI